MWNTETHLFFSYNFVIMSKIALRNFTKFPIAFLIPGGYNKTIKRDSEIQENGMEGNCYGEEAADCRIADMAHGIYDSSVSFGTGHDGKGSGNNADRSLWRQDG